MQNRRSSTTAILDASRDRWKLQASDLELSLDPADLGFQTTEELEPLDHLHGQERALRALEFGLAVRHRGHNIWRSGSPAATACASAPPWRMSSTVCGMNCPPR